MTDYSTMQAGPEMDALVAEKVMGWVRCGIYWFIGATEGRYVNRWKPSTNDADACRVLGKLGERCDWEMDYFGGKEYTCTILVPQHVPQTATAPTLALAICRAALMTTKEANDD